MSKATLVLQDDKALQAIREGVRAISEPVKRTLGPECGTTLMYRTYGRGPRNVDDGYWTAQAIEPKSPFTKLAAEFYKESIKKTNEKVGDGTSSTSCVAAALFEDIYPKLLIKSQGYSSGKRSGSGVIAVKKDILAKADEVKEAVRKLSKPVKTLEELEKISAISLGSDNEISKTVAKMAWDVGVDGYIDVVEGYKGEIETETIKGARYPAKVCGKAFVNVPEKYEMVVEDCPIFITNFRLDNDMLARYIISKFNETKVIIVAPGFSDDVLVNMLLGRKNGTFIWPVKVPSLRTEQLEDLACVCGATLVNKDTGMKLQQVTEKDLGYLAKLVVKDAETREDAVFIGGRGAKGEAVKQRIQTLQGQKKETKQENFKMLMVRRIASMDSSIGVIRVGAPTEAESLPLKLKIEDDANACRAALKSGCVRGGGLCLKSIAEKLPDDHVLKNALMAPWKQIQENAGGHLEIGKDVIDPTDAVYYTVEHAASCIASLITVKTLVAEEPEMMLGEGQKMMADAMKAFVGAWKLQQGIMTENEKLALNDANGGLTGDEKIELDQG